MAPLVDDPNTVKTKSGLKYVDLVAGTGATPVSTDLVTIEFTATLQDGTMIGASRQRGGPAEFALESIAQELQSGRGQRRHSARCDLDLHRRSAGHAAHA